jgi:hypothetical protein
MGGFCFGLRRATATWGHRELHTGDADQRSAVTGVDPQRNPEARMHELSVSPSGLGRTWFFDSYHFSYHSELDPRGS